MFSLLHISISTCVNATGFVNDDYTVTVKEGYQSGGTCWAKFNNSINENGQFYYLVDGSKDADPLKMSYCAGYLEGYLATKQIYQSYKAVKAANIGEGNEYSEGVKKFFDDNVNFIEKSIDAYLDSEYWKQVAYIFNIAKGMYKGYSDKCDVTQIIDKTEFYIHNFFSDIFDVLYLNNEIKENDPIRAKCTAEIRLLPDFSDVFVAHNAWADYRLAFGTIVEYNLPIPLFKSHRVKLSTTLGMVGSLDDFYIADSGLIVFETSLMSMTDELKAKITPKGLFATFRSLLATFVATNGSEWRDAFSRYNTGTYNNDYFAIDTKLIEKDKKPEKDFVWLVEQIPGAFYPKDVTKNLTSEGFISSFNVPFDQKLYDLLGYPKHKDEPIYFYPYFEHPRYQISKRDVPKITKYSDFQHFIRYNKYQTDPVSKNHSALTISSREDLMGKIPEGAFNAKTVQGTRVYTTMRLDFVNSPTFEDQEPFSWSQFPEIKHEGLPQNWTFDWNSYSDTFNRCKSYHKSDDCLAQKFCGWCGRKNLCMPGTAEGPFDAKCYSGWKAVGLSDNIYIITLSIVAALIVFGGLGLAWFFFKRSRIPNGGENQYSQI